MVFHCLNRAVARLPLFEKDRDYEAFESVLAEAHERTPLRILDYTVMPNHWHFVVWPQTDDEVTQFFQWLTGTHTMRWHAHRRTGGTGHVYQGRFKSFPVQSDEHLFTVLRYIERNPVRANLVRRAEDWLWGSAWLRSHGTIAAQKILSAWPRRRPTGWLAHVNRDQSPEELVALRRSVNRGAPFGDPQWVQESASRLDLDFTLRPRGRPPKKSV
jgi:putative transposase